MINTVNSILNALIIARPNCDIYILIDEAFKYSEYVRTKCDEYQKKLNHEREHIFDDLKDTIKDFSNELKEMQE